MGMSVVLETKMFAGSLLLSLALLFSFLGNATGQISPDKAVVYKKTGEVELKLHVFLPKNGKKKELRPAAVFFFGGGWNGGSPNQFYPHCRYLASRGMVAFAAEYRVKSRNNTTPRECVEDAKSAVRWIRQHAKEWGIHPDLIVAGGGSAGGHIAAATGTTQGFEGAGEELRISSRPNALVLFNPVFDNGPNGYGHARVKEYWKDFSPLHNINESTPPTVVFLGTEDKLIPVDTAKAYKRRMEALDLTCDLYLYNGQPHGFFNYKNRKNYMETVTQMDRFLTSLGFLDGEPTVKRMLEGSNDK